jgi:hypothetical protein
LISGPKILRGRSTPSTTPWASVHRRCATYAHAADPNAKPYINDYNIEGLGAKSDAIYNLAKSLLAQDMTLHGIGLQSPRRSPRIPLPPEC